MRYRKIERGGKEERERKEQESGKQNREDDIETEEKETETDMLREAFVICCLCPYLFDRMCAYLCT